jgi:hypothetical protein
MSVWQFRIESDRVKMGDRDRVALTSDGCNEPYKNRYWCPSKRWFLKAPCPFVNRNECRTFKLMCGSL